MAQFFIFWRDDSISTSRKPVNVNETTSIFAEYKNMLIEFIVQLAYFMVVRLINALCRSLEILDSREYDIP